MRFSAKNFQPWAEFTLDLDGLTLLVGPSNQGKSSIFRALRGLFRNELPADFVRNDQDDRMEVSLEIAGTPTILATRTRKGSTKYEIGTDEFKALGHSVPDKVKALNFNKVVVGKATMDPIFSEQNRAQFLIDPETWKPEEISSILGAFSSTEKLDAGKKEVGLRITQKNSEARTLAEEIREAEERRAKFSKLSGRAEGAVSQVDDVGFLVEGCEVRLSLLSEALERSSRIADLEILTSNLYIPDVSKEELLFEKARLLSRTVDHLSRSQFLSKLGGSLDNVVLGWEAATKSYRLHRGLIYVLGATGRREMSPGECAKRLTDMLKHMDSNLSLMLRQVSIIKVTNTILPARERVKAKEVEAVVAGTELEKAEATQAGLKLKLGGPKCPKCGGTLACPTCR